MKGRTFSSEANRFLLFHADGGLASDISDHPRHRRAALAAEIGQLLERPHQSSLDPDHGSLDKYEYQALP